MIDNLLGSLDYTTKIPLTTKENTELPKFPDLSPVNINSLLTNQQIENKSVSFDDLLKQTNQKYGRAETLGNPYFINKYEYDRFINSDKDNNSFFDWKKNPIFKNPMYFNNEQLNAENQSAFRKFINGSSKALPGALGAFVSGLDPRPGVRDNEFNQWINDWTKELEYTHPNYYTQDEIDHPLAFRNITSGNFWGDKLLKNAGFTVGAIASAIAWDAVITSVTAGAGAVPATELALGKLITSLEKQFSTVQKVIRGAEGTSMLGKTITSSKAAYAGIKDWSAGQKALNLAKLGYINYVGSNAEASLEGYQGLIDLNEKLIQEFTTKNGKEPEAEDYASIKKIATQMANTRYAINLPLLMVTNAIEFGTLFSPSKIIRTGGVGFGERIGANEAGQLFQRGWKDFSKLEKAGSILGSAPVRDFLAEGFQEGAQYSIEKATEDLGFKKFKNPNFRIGLSEYMESEALGIQKTFSENEGLESMFIGGLTGLITAGGTSAWDKFVSKKSEKEQKIIGVNIDAYNTLASEDLLNADSFKEYLKSVAERDQINFDSTTTHLILDAQMQQAIKDKNAFAFKALQHDKLFNLISLATKLGKVDAFKLKIDQLKDLSIDEFAQQMGITNLTDNQKQALQDNIYDYIEVVKDRVDSMSEIIKTVDNGLLNKFDPEKEPAKFNAFNSLKETFAYQLSHIEDIQGRMTEEMDNILSSKVNPLSQSLLNTLTGQEDPDESLIIDDFTKNFISEKGFDLNILNTKYAKGYTQQFNQLASEIATLNMQVETAKAAKLPYSGYASKLADKKKELSNLTTFLEEFNTKIKKFGETSALRKDFMHQEVIDSFKDLTAHVVKYEMNKDLKKSIGLTQTDDLVNAIADLHLLNSSLGVFVDKNNKFRTPEGQDQYMNEYLKWKSFAENKVQEAVRKSKYETLRRTPEESINELSSEITANLSEIENINAQLEQIDAQLLEAPTEELQKQKEELLKEKEALLEENKELEETKEIIEGKVDTEAEFVTEDSEKEDILPVEEITPVETIEPGMEIGLKRGLKAKWSSTSKKFIFFNAKGQRIVASSQLKRQAVKLSNMPNVLKVWWNELLTNKEKKDIVSILPELEAKLVEYFNIPRDTVQTSDAIIMNGLRGVKFKPQGVVNNVTDLNHKKWISDDGLDIDRVVNEGLKDDLYENGFTDMDEKEIADDIFRLISAYPKGINKDDVKKELFQSSDNLNYEIREAEKDFLLRYGLDAVTAIELLKEQIKEFNYEQDDESTGEPETPETIKTITGNIPTKTKTVTPTPTPEVEVLPYFGTSRLMHSFYYKLANRTFGNVMIASFHNFLGKLRTFDGIGHKQNLESFLNQNNLQFTVLLAPDELYTPNGDYFDEAYKDKKAPVVALTDKEGNLVKVDENNNVIQRNNPEIERRRQEDLKGASRLLTKEEQEKRAKKYDDEIADYQEMQKFGNTPEESFDGLADNLAETNPVTKLRKQGLSDEEIDKHPEFLEWKRKQSLFDRVGEIVGVKNTEDFTKDWKEIINIVEQDKEKLPNKKKRDLQQIKEIDARYDAEYGGNFIVSLLPNKPTGSETDIKDFQSTIERVNKGEKVVVEIDASHAGHFNFLGEKSNFTLTSEVLENPYVSLFIPNTKTGVAFNGYNLMNGKLYLKIEDNTKPVMFLDVKLSKLSDISLNGKPLSATVHSVMSHVIANPDETIPYKQEVFNFLNSILYTDSENPVEINIEGNAYEFKVDTLSESPKFIVKKNGEIIFELSKDKRDDAAKLQNIFKLFDLNDKNQEEIKIPSLEGNRLKFETKPYNQFLIDSAKPTVRYPLDFSKANPFDFTGGEIYFKSVSNVEEAFPEQTNNVEGKKADIENYFNDNTRSTPNSKYNPDLSGEGELALREQEEQLLQLGADRIQAHGISKGSIGQQFKDLLNILTKGLDKRGGGQLYTAPLVMPKNMRAGAGAALGTGGGTAYTDGGFIILAKLGVNEIKSIDDIGGVLVNQAVVDSLPELINKLKQLFPNLSIDSYTNSPKVISEINAKYDAGSAALEEVEGVSGSALKDVDRISNKEIKTNEGEINTGVLEEAKDIPNVNKVIAKDKNGNDIKVVINGDKLKGTILSRNGTYLFKAMQGRVFTLAKVGNFYLPFYISSAGTSGKIQGQWYPFFGYNNWLVKGHVGKSGEMEYSKNITEVQNLLNENFIIPAQYLQADNVVAVGEQFVPERDANGKIIREGKYNFEKMIPNKDRKVLYDLTKDIDIITHHHQEQKGETKLNEHDWVAEKTGLNPKKVINDGKGSADNWIKKLVELTETKSKAPTQYTEAATQKKEVVPSTKESNLVEVIVKKDDKSNWTLLIQPNGDVFDKKTGDKITIKSLINKAHLKSGFVQYEKITANNKKDYAYTEDGRVISLNKTSMGDELDIVNSSIAKEVIAKSTKFKKEEISEEPKDNSSLTKENTTKVVKRKNIFEGEDDINLELKSAKSLPAIQSLNVTNTDIERVQAIFKGNVNIENLFQIANSDAWATFTQSGVTLFKGATRADLFHEAWHNFSQLYLTKPEKVRLYKETRDRVKELEGKSDLEVEEYIAREFAKFTETGKIEGNFPERKSIFEKIMDFLKSIFSDKADLSLDTLFTNLYKGQINHLSYSTDNIMFGKLNSGINDNFSFNDRKLILSGMDALFVKALEYKGISESQTSNIKNIGAVYSLMAKAIQNMYNDTFDEKGDSINPELSLNIERIADNWVDIKKAHFESSIIFNGDRNNFEINDEGEVVTKEENEDDKKGRNKADFQEASEKSIFDIMDKEVKSLIFTLVDKDQNGEEIIDPVFGLPKLVDFQRYVNVIVEKLSNQNNFKDVEKVLKELSKDYKPMGDLLNRLILNDSAEVKQLRVKFIQNMALVKRKLYTVLYREENQTYVPTLSSSNKKKQAENDIISYFFISPTSSIIKDVNGEKQITEPIEYIQNKGLDYDLKFIKDLGINTEFLDYMTPTEQKQLIEDLRLPFIVEHLNNYLKQTSVIKDLFKALNTEIKGQKQDSTLKTLIAYNLDFKPDNISASSLNAEGKIESENVLWATLDRDFNALQNAESLEELNKNPNRVFYNPNYLDMGNSKLLELLFDKNGKRSKETIEINNYNGLDTTKVGTEGRKTKEVFYTEKAIMDVSQFINKNILTTMQLSNKATYWGFGFSKPLVSDIYDFQDTMMGYLIDELNIISEFDRGNPELTKLSKLSKAIGTKDNYNFAIFKDILTYNPQEIINEYLENGNLSEQTKSIVAEQIKDFVKEEIREHYEVLKNDITKLNPTSNSKFFNTFTALSKNKQNPYEFLLEAYIQNQFVFNVELSKITFGNPYMHKDVYKRIAGATSSGRRMLVDKQTLMDFNSITKETQRSSTRTILLNRLGLQELNLKNQRTSDEELRFVTFKDRESQSEVFSNLINTVNSELKKQKKGTTQYNALFYKKVAIERAYKNVKGSDAMGAITMDAWKKVNWISGRWSPELENIYQKTIKWDYHNRLLKAAQTEEEKTKQLSLRNENILKDDEVVAISVMKYQYYGNVKNMSIAEKAFHKYQLMPLIPQLIEGKNWEHHLDRMLLDDVDYVLFDSGDKLEKINTLNDFYNDEEQTNVNVLEDYKYTYSEGNTSYNVRTGYLENLKEQVFMENGQDNSLLFGSQVRKLLFNTESFSDLYNEFRDTIKTLTDLEKNKLFKNSGLNENGEVTDKKKFVQFLLDELDKKVVNSNVKEYLRLTKAGEFVGALDTNLQRQPIESIINSVLQNKIVKQKMHGELMVQVSNVGFETFGQKDNLKFYTLENGKVRKMEVKIPLSGKFKNLLNLTHSDGRKITTRERLNEMIKQGKIDTRSITMVGYRIPTQEHNSIEIMQVQEFLDPISNLVIVPYEITAKTGSDFDIDKLNLFKPHINSRGEYVENVSEEKIQELKTEIADMQEVLEEFKTALKTDKFVLDELSDEYMELDNFIRLLKTPDEELTPKDMDNITALDIKNIFYKQLKDSLYVDEKDRKQILRSYIDRIKEVRESQSKTATSFKINKDFVNYFYSVAEDSKQFKAGKQNNIIEIFEKVMMSPDNFLNLVTPNSTFMFDEALNSVFEMRYPKGYMEKEGKLMPVDIKNTKSLVPRYNWFTFKVLGDAGAGLGIAAVGNTFSQLIQKAKVNFTEEYLENFDIKFNLNDISNRYLSDGQSKATAYSQLINLLVDVANDPRVGYANMGDKVIPIVNLMINFGIPIQDIVYFLNQPIIVDYISFVSKNRKSVVDGEYAEDGFRDYFNKVLLNSTKAYLNLGERPYKFNVKASELPALLDDVDFNISKDNMKYSTKDFKDSSKMTKEESDKLSKEQLLLLSQFAQFEEMAKDFLELQITMNFDTTLVQDGFEAYQKENLFAEIKQRNVFTNLDTLRDSTVIAPLNVLKEVVNINAQLLPLANDKVIYNFLSFKLATDFARKGNKTKKKFLRTFKNDYIMYIFQNFIDRSPKAMLDFNTTFATVLKQEDKDFTNRPNAFGSYLLRNLYKDLAVIKNDPKYKDLMKQYLLLERLFVSSEEEFKNIGLSYFNKDSQLQDTYIEQFKELLNSPDLEIRNFMLKFAFMSFYQSGLNKSFISSTDILPVKVLSTMLEDVREQYLKEVNTPMKVLNVLESFYTKLLENNEGFRNKDNRSASLNTLGVAYYRGKYYRDNLDEVLQSKKEEETEESGCESPF